MTPFSFCVNVFNHILDLFSQRMKTFRSTLAPWNRADMLLSVDLNIVGSDGAIEHSSLVPEVIAHLSQWSESFVIASLRGSCQHVFWPC